MTENEYRQSILESNLSTNARLVCFVLLHHRNRKTNLCNPSIALVAQSTGLSRSSVKRAAKELCAFQFITIRHKKASKNLNLSNEYIFPISGSTQDLGRSTEDQGGRFRSRSTQNPKPIEPIKKGNFCFQEEKKLMDFGGDWGAYQEYMKEKGRLTVA